jgi:hypothetical protein
MKRSIKLITKIILTIIGVCLALYSMDMVFQALVIHGSPFSCLPDALFALGIEFSLYVIWCPRAAAQLMAKR